MKILYLTIAFLDKYDAPVYHVTGFCNALAELGHSVHLLYPSPGRGFRPALAASIRCIPVRYFTFRGWGRLFIFWYSCKLRLLPLQSYDMIYLRLPPDSRFFAILKKSRVPLVYELNGQEGMKHPGFKKWARYFSLISTDSEETIRLASQFWQIPAEHFAINQNAGIDPQFFKHETPAANAPIIEDFLKDGFFRIAHISSFRPAHDFDTIFDALRGLDFPYKIICFGDGTEKQSVEAKCIQYQIPAVFPGALPLATVASILSRCDLCINALKGYSQKCGNFRAFKLYEYMAAGVPTIETIDPGLPVPVWAEECLGLVPYENSGALRSMIIDARANPGKWHEKAKKAKKWVFENRTWKCVAQNMLTVFNQKGFGKQ